MRFRTCLLFLLIGVFVIGNVHIAFGNGRQTPQLRGASPLKAICSRSAGVPLEIFRVRLIDNEGSDETLKVTIGGIMEEISLSEIKLLSFLTTEINSDGFIEAKIIRIDGIVEKSALVKVRSNVAMIQLVGFRSNGTSVRIDLSKCQTVAFSPLGEGATGRNYQPVTAD